MKELGEKLYIAPRTIPRFPFGEECAAEQEAKVENDPLSKLLASADQSSTIRVSTEDEVESIKGDVEGVPHVGPIEAKIIRGSDGRNYVMEVMRLTPRDANFVKGEQGTGLVPDETLDALDSNIVNALVLRQELVSIYIHRQVNLARQTLLVEANKKEEEAKAASGSATTATKETATAETPAASSQAVTVEDVEGDGEGPQIVKETSTPEIDDKALNTLAAEYIEKFRAITPASLGIEINPNVFLNFSAGIDAEVLKKDEDTAREMAKFLIDFVLPSATRQVREGELYPKDLDSMCNLLHRMGINMRYLGMLAKLAHEQEMEDAELLSQGRQRVHSMPYYWQEFLIVELLARTCKHLLNNAMRADKAIAAQPAETIAHLLNHILSVVGGTKKVAVAEEETGDKKKQGNRKGGNKKTSTTAPAAPTSAPTSTATAGTTQADKKKKNKKSKSTPAVVPATVETIPTVSSPFADRHSFLQSVVVELKKRFMFSSPLLAFALNETEAMSDADKHYVKMLRSRLSPVMLVRRIAQQCGIVLAARSYDFQCEDAFHLEDVVDVVPKVKSFEPDSYIAEYSDYLSSAAAHMQQGNAVAAYELAQQALAIINQVSVYASTFHCYPS